MVFLEGEFVDGADIKGQEVEVLLCQGLALQADQVLVVGDYPTVGMVGLFGNGGRTHMVDLLLFSRLFGEVILFIRKLFIQA